MMGLGGAMVLLAILAAFLVSACACWLIVRRGSHLYLDHPDARSLHHKPVPRLGGVAIVAGISVAAAVTWGQIAEIADLYFCAAVLVLFLLALLDDKSSLPPVLRFAVQAGVAVMLVWQGIYFYTDNFTLLWLCLGVLVLMWGINLYNFMDGMDGFAGSMSVIGFSTLALLGAVQGQYGFAWLCMAIVAASAGFLCFNFPPARLFMGDSGSTVLGLAMGVLSIKGWQLSLYPIWVPAVIFSPFWVDATLTLLLRLFRGEKIWLPHRQHIYQRWVLAGYSHRQVTGMQCLLMLCCAGSVLFWHMVEGQRSVYPYALPIFWLLGYSLLVGGSIELLRRKVR